MRQKSDKWHRIRAMSIVRGEMRHLGRVPHRVMGRDAFAFLDDLARQAANTELHAWYSSATEASLDKWVKEWDAWARVEHDSEVLEAKLRKIKK